MNTYLRSAMQKLRKFAGAAGEFWLTFKRILREQVNKNIYTRILFTNVTVFAIAMTVLTIFSSYVLQQAVYEQVQQELLRKAKRVNFALLQQADQGGGGAAAELLKYLADIFDARITVFDREGHILATSAEQDIVPGSKLEARFIDILALGEPATARIVDRETGLLTFIAIVPMGNTNDPIENGILLETKPSNFDLVLNKIRLYLVAGGAAILVAIIFISVYMATSIARPISRLAAAVAEISRGSYVVSAEDQPPDEINALAGQLNILAVKLQKIQAESSKMEEDRSRLFEEISHELRTPLTAIQGFVEAIRDGIVQDEALRQRYLDTIYTQTVHISRLVDDMLALSRLESGSITVEKLPVNLTALAEGVAMSMEAEARKMNTSILLENKTENAMVIGDVDRMEQIIRNLLKNAVRATENGVIRIGVEARQNEVVLTIEDNGIGIPPEDLPHIWDRFYRIKNVRDSHRKEKGSGLGLVIVKKLVQLQDGKIDVSSQPGKGTTFSISFPAVDITPKNL